jgi:hypothetical protein
VDANAKEGKLSDTVHMQIGGTTYYYVEGTPVRLQIQRWGGGTSYMAILSAKPLTEDEFKRYTLKKRGRDLTNYAMSGAPGGRDRGKEAPTSSKFADIPDGPLDKIAKMVGMDDKAHETVKKSIQTLRDKVGGRRTRKKNRRTK